MTLRTKRSNVRRFAVSVRSHKPRCGICRKHEKGPMRTVAGKPRCYWCHKRIAGL